MRLILRFTPNKHPLDKRFNPQILTKISGLSFSILPRSTTMNTVTIPQQFTSFFLPLLHLAAIPVATTFLPFQSTLNVVWPSRIARGKRDWDQNEEMERSLTSSGRTETMRRRRQDIKSSLRFLLSLLPFAVLGHIDRCKWRLGLGASVGREKKRKSHTVKMYRSQPKPKGHRTEKK